MPDEDKTRTQLVRELKKLRQQVAQLEKAPSNHKQAETLRAAERQYRNTLDSMADAIHVVDANLRIVFINQTFERWCKEFGFETKTIGRTVFEVFPFLPEKVHDEYRRVFETGKILVTEESNTFEEREVITETRKVPILEKGKVVSILTLVRDITDRQAGGNGITRKRTTSSPAF